MLTFVVVVVVSLWRIYEAASFKIQKDEYACGHLHTSIGISRQHLVTALFHEDPCLQLEKKITKNKKITKSP